MPRRSERERGGSCSGHATARGHGETGRWLKAGEESTRDRGAAPARRARLHILFTIAEESAWKKIFSRNARHPSGGSTGHLSPLPTGHSPSPFPFFSHPLLLIQAVCSGGVGVVSELRALQQPGLGY
eukprot:scaffold27055_cov133-Isochrysis_galbana.AAC.3